MTWLPSALIEALMPHLSIAPILLPLLTACVLLFLSEHRLRTKTAVSLAAALLNPPPKSVRYGNYGGALDWPIPLDSTSQRQLQAGIRFGKFDGVELAPYDNVLDYLMQGRTLEPSDGQNPQKVIDQLVQSDRAQALGKAIQASFDAKSVKGSVDDWLLAALNVDLKIAAHPHRHLRLFEYLEKQALNTRTA